MEARLKRIEEIRQQQPEAELERKWLKAQGRWSNRFWAQEWLDLAACRAAKIWAWMQQADPELRRPSSQEGGE